jgi:hypothetical protein
MALKAYKHLTDGEVKIVNEGSAEETSLLADTVTGSSYLQLTSTGHSQEVAAAQGTALWVDVTSDLGSGGGGGLPTGMDYQVFEVTDLLTGMDYQVTFEVTATSVDSVAGRLALPGDELATAIQVPLSLDRRPNQAASYYLPDAFSGQVDLQTRRRRHRILDRHRDLPQRRRHGCGYARNGQRRLPDVLR